MEICDRCEELSEEQQKQVDMGKLEAAGQFFAAWTDPVSLVNTGDIGSIPSEYGAGLIYRGKRSTAIYGPAGWMAGTRRITRRIRISISAIRNPAAAMWTEDIPRWTW